MNHKKAFGRLGLLFCIYLSLIHTDGANGVSTISVNKALQTLCQTRIELKDTSSEPSLRYFD